MRLGEVRLQPDGAPQMRDRLLVAAERAQGERDVVAALRILRLERDRLADQVNGIGIASGLVRQHAEIVQARRVLRLDRKRLAIMQVGVGELSGLMVADGGREQLRDRRPWRVARRPLVLPAQNGVPVIGLLSAKQRSGAIATPPRLPWRARRACARSGRAAACAAGSTSASPRPARRRRYRRAPFPSVMRIGGVRRTASSFEVVRMFVSCLPLSTLISRSLSRVCSPTIMPR